VLSLRQVCVWLGVAGGPITGKAVMDRLSGPVFAASADVSQYRPRLISWHCVSVQLCWLPKGRVCRRCRAWFS
jgi:hypothetical protein